jgi:CRP-like cAMP-binding protein
VTGTGTEDTGISSAGDLRSMIGQNLLLSQLPDPDRETLASSAHILPLPDRADVYRAGDRLDQVLFPLEGMLSLVRTMEDGTSIETGVVGREGFVDVGLFLGGNGAVTDALVQIGGRAAAVPEKSFRDAIDRATGFREILERYARGVIAATGQGAACNRLHPLDQRLARWLAMCHRRAPRDSFPFTHEFLAEILGVRRASVSEVMQNLQDSGVLAYSRGRLRIRDPGRLEERACECLRVMEEALHPPVS